MSDETIKIEQNNIKHGMVFRLLAIFFIVNGIIGQQIEYYSFLRVIIFFVSLNIIASFIEKKSQTLIFFTALMMIIFNPFYQFSLSSELWILIDSLAILVITASLFLEQFELFEKLKIKISLDRKIYFDENVAQKLAPSIRWLAILPLSFLIPICSVYLVYILFIGEYGEVKTAAVYILGAIFAMLIVFTFLRVIVVFAPKFKQNILTTGVILIYLFLFVGFTFNTSRTATYENWQVLAVNFTFTVYALSFTHELFIEYIANINFNKDNNNKLSS